MMMVVVVSLSSSLTSIAVMGKLDNMAWISFLKKFSGEIMCQWLIRFGFFIAFTQASYQHHDGLYLLKRGKEVSLLGCDNTLLQPDEGPLHHGHGSLADGDDEAGPAELCNITYRLESIVLPDKELMHVFPGSTWLASQVPGYHHHHGPQLLGQDHGLHLLIHEQVLHYGGSWDYGTVLGLQRDMWSGKF
jgi:hypothetical protein